MMKEEFEARVGFKVSCAEYEAVEKVYMNEPQNLDKDRFCKKWLKEGGLQWVLDGRQAEINALKTSVKKEQEESNNWKWIAEDNRKNLNAFKERNEEVEKFLKAYAQKAEDLVMQFRCDYAAIPTRWETAD